MDKKKSPDIDDIDEMGMPPGMQFVEFRTSAEKRRYGRQWGEAMLLMASDPKAAEKLFEAAELEAELQFERYLRLGTPQ